MSGKTMSNMVGALVAGGLLIFLYSNRQGLSNVLTKQVAFPGSGVVSGATSGARPVGPVMGAPMAAGLLGLLGNFGTTFSAGSPGTVMSTNTGIWTNEDILGLNGVPMGNGGDGDAG